MRGMFTRIAGMYDRLNRVQSLGLDVLWRHRALARLARVSPSPHRILDLATGTAEKDRKKGYYGNASKEHFHDLYEWYSSVEFRDDLNEESLYFPVINSPEIYRSKMVFFVLQSLDTAAVSAIRKIHEQNIPVVVYYVSGIADELKGRKLPNTEFIQIPPEADLKEVM